MKNKMMMILAVLCCCSLAWNVSAQKKKTNIDPTQAVVLNRYLIPKIETVLGQIQDSEAQIAVLTDSIKLVKKGRYKMRMRIYRLQDKLYDDQKHLTSLFTSQSGSSAAALYQQPVSKSDSLRLVLDTIFLKVQGDVKCIEPGVANSAGQVIFSSSIPKSIYFRIQLCTVTMGNYRSTLFSQFPGHIAVDVPPYTVIFSQVYDTYEKAISALPYATQFYRRDAFITRWDGKDMVEKHLK